MSNQSVDPTARVDRQLDSLIEPLEKEAARTSYIIARLHVVRTVMDTDISEAMEETDRLIEFLEGNRKRVRAELVRLRTPDS